MNVPHGTLEARDVVQRASGRVILGPVDCAVGEGDFVAIVGPNGAGKTTLLRLLTGIAEPDAGEVLFCGEPIADLASRARARRIAYVPQVRPASVPLTVRQLVQLGRYPHLSRWQRAPSAADRAAVEGTLDRVGLAALAERRLDGLSGGERQAAYLAAALAPGAEVLVLDEPATHLDPRHQCELAALLADLHAEGRTIVAATHDLAFAAVLADRLVVLAGGRIVADDAVEALMTPERLSELFAAPFVVDRIGGRPVPRLAFEVSALEASRGGDPERPGR